MANPIVSFTRICILSFLITGYIALVCSSATLNTRSKRANHAQFLNAHVVSPKTYKALLNSPSPGKHWDNLMQGITRKGQNINGATPNAYHQRPKHTFIVGNRKEVSNSAAGTPLPSTGRYNNLYQSSRPFQQVQVHRTGNGYGPIKNIYDMGTTSFHSGVDKNKKPVHYQPGGHLGNPGFGNNQGNNAPRRKTLYSAPFVPNANSGQRKRWWGGGR